MTRGPYRDLAFSPDGTRLVFVAGLDGPNKELWVRAVDHADAVQLRGLNNPNSPFISPDSEWVGFASANDLMRVPMSGGPPTLICHMKGSLRGASWGPHDTIVFATADPATGLFVVSAAGGGEPQVLTTPDPTQLEADHLFPSVLPGGQVLFTITTASGADNSKLAALPDRKTGLYKPLGPSGGHAEYLDAANGSGQAPSTSSGQGGYLATQRAARCAPCASIPTGSRC